MLNTMKNKYAAVFDSDLIWVTTMCFIFYSESCLNSLILKRVVTVTAADVKDS